MNKSKRKELRLMREGQGNKWSKILKISESADLAKTCIIHTAAQAKNNKKFRMLADCEGGPEKKLIYLQNIRQRRLQLPRNSSESLREACNSLPDTLHREDLKIHGYHDGCYKVFTRNLDRLPIPVPVQVPVPFGQKTPHDPSSPTPILSPNSSVVSTTSVSSLFSSPGAFMID